MDEVESTNKGIGFYKGLTEINKEDIDYFVKLDIKLPNGNVIRIDIMSPLDINYDNIESDLEIISSQFGFWCSVYSEFKYSVEVKEAEFKGLKSKAAVRFIEEGKILKKTDLDLYINSMKSIQEFEKNLLYDKMQLDKLKSFLKAIEMKFEALRSLAGFKRQEYNQSR
jgi:hypothetical protein